MFEKEKTPVEDIKKETKECAVCEDVDASGGCSRGASEANKRAAEMGSDVIIAEVGQSNSSKRVRVSVEEQKSIEKLPETVFRPQPLSLTTAGEKREHGQGKTRVSFRKPLYSISHRITEKRVASSQDQHTHHEGGVRLSYSSLLSPKLSTAGEHSRCEPILPAMGTAGATSSADSNIYPLIEKMFFILNTLNSSMTQLHSKVDLLSLEVTRIKKQIKPSEMVTEFQPPPEYLLTSEELSQLMEQTSSAGELGCRLLVHLFPELFKAKECTHGCIASKRTLDSLHLQLIRNYVEVCFPLVKNNNIWQDECLLQINDFFNSFWAQKDMESGQSSRKRTITGLDIKAETCHFINAEGQEEHLSIDTNGHTNNVVVSDLVLDTQIREDLEEFSSPEDFVVLLVNRLFPEVFEEGKMPEGPSGFSSVGQLILDSDRIEIIRKYMEANFPEVPEDTWLQVCVQRIEDALEHPHSNGNGSELDNFNEETFDSTSLPDDVSIVKISDLCDFERPIRKSKKSLLTPVDFDKLEVPVPDFTVPKEYLLSKEQLRNNYDCSLSIGNFASRLLVLMFPELFTYENARKHYNCSGSLGKKQLDPVRVNLIRHYVQLLYPRARNDRIWTLEFVGKLDERCRRRDTEQRRSYQQQRKVYAPESEQEPVDFLMACQENQLSTDNLQRDDFDIPPLPPEKSSKDFCKIPLDELTVLIPDFPVPSVYLLSDTEVREIVQQSLSVGNFAARLLVRLFPELFTQENLRLQYNHSGACNKKQLDPVRLRLIRHYVEAVYPVEKMEEVWHYECVPSIDERCRRPNRKKCDILKKAKRSSTVS